MTPLGLVFALTALSSVAARSAINGRGSIHLLRGGALDVDLEEEVDTSELKSEEETPRGSMPASMPASMSADEPLKAVALTRDEIVAKLNHIPTFAIVNDDGQMVGLQDKDSGVFACCWFTDPDEAKALHEATRAANPDKKLKLVVAGMGGAFASCNGFSDNQKETEDLKTTDDDKVELRLQGTHGLVGNLKPKLLTLLEKQGIDPGCWTLPVFMCEELQSRAICPVFLHPADLAATWAKAGRDPAKLPENLTVMDLRMLVAAMQTDANAWSLIQFVGSAKAAELAMEIGKQVSEKGA